jgi:formamidopyrimidine-DNA glycosylase
MPELPEVERAARLLRAAIVGRRITGVRVLHPSLRAKLPPPDQRRLTGRTVRDVVRRGKHQVIDLDDGTALVAHFRMTGDWTVARVGDVAARYARAELDLDDGTRVTLADSRALATLVRTDDPATVLPPLGPEPDDPSLTPASLGASLARRRGAIKPALLDQRVLAGVGNIYAAEALWRARIDPRAAACALDSAQLRRLLAAIRTVLRRAPAGRYQADTATSRWNVYDREGLTCRRCGGTVRRIVQAGRSTYYCPKCQTTGKA